MVATPRPADSRLTGAFAFVRGAEGQSDRTIEQEAWNLEACSCTVVGWDLHPADKATTHDGQRMLQHLPRNCFHIHIGIYMRAALYPRVGRLAFAGQLLDGLLGTNRIRDPLLMCGHATRRAELNLHLPNGLALFLDPAHTCFAM